MANIQQHTGTENLAVRIGTLIDEARKRVLTVVNTTMVYTYYEIGRMIVEDEQNGQMRADYGKQVLQNVAKKLTAKYGKGFSYSNLRQMRQFYITFVESDKHRLSNCTNTVDSIQVNTEDVGNEQFPKRRVTIDQHVFGADITINTINDSITAYSMDKNDCKKIKEILMDYNNSKGDGIVFG